MKKPPYKVPLLSTLVVPPDAPTVVSTFSGMGGSCLGFKMAGFRHLLACEFVEEARKTYKANFPGVPVYGEDIRKLAVPEVLRLTGLKVGELDVFEGSPPCSSFSTAGKGAKGWGKAKKYSDNKVQRTDDLFDEYLRLLVGLQPRFFVAENVSGLVKGAAKGTFIDILKRMKAAGYRAKAQLLNAQWLGVPQARQRIIFVGVREDIVDAAGHPIEPPFPKPLPYCYSIRDACPWIARVEGGKYAPHSSKGKNFPVDAPIPTIVAGSHGGGSHQFYVEGPTEEERRAASIEKYAIGDEWDNVEVGKASEKYFSLVKPDPERPCPTITQTAGNPGAAGVCHPFEKRKFTVGEVKRLSGVPDDFKLTGTFMQQWERMGRCVPPVMMMHVAKAVKGALARCAR